MKLMILLFLSTSGSYGQSWFPDDAIWHYSYGNMSTQGWILGYVSIEVDGDTVIDGQLCKRLNKTRESAWPGASPVTQALGENFVFESNGLVMAYDPALPGFDTLYNMNAVPGAQWQLVGLPDPTCDTLSHMLVTDTGTMVVDDVPLRWLAIEVHYYVGDTTPILIATDTIMERIGTLYTYLLPQDMCAAMLDWREGGPLRCYSDGQIDLMRDEDIPCDLVVGIEEDMIDQSGLMVWPNPSADELNISWNSPSGKTVRIEIHSMLGHAVRSVTLNTAPITIDMHTLPAGCYAVHLIGEEGRSVAKWIKQ